ncbi:MAG: NAD-dependent epimerase/dehydratase family protein [Parcubacteria group bacterium]|nr:NAD-dependent epimerase/dehydratase family protein [Parcubacteria group bacterium]
MENRKKTKILVTGSAGFMGSHLYDHLAAAGHNVYGVDDLSGGFLRNVSDKKRFTKLDLRDRKKTGDFIARLKPELIYHLAADATEGRSQFTPFSAMDRNWGAYMNLLVPAIKNGLKKMVITSSMSVYGSQKPPFSEDMEPRPEDIYAISKASMEVSTKILSNVHGFRYVIVRPHNVYGPRQNLSDPYRNVLGIFMNRLLRDKYFYIYGDGKQKRAFSYIDDVTAAMAALGFNPKCDGRIFNIGSDHPTTVNSRLTGYKAKTVLKDGIGEMVTWAKAVGPQKFRYLENLDLINHLTPKTWKNKLL